MSELVGALGGIPMFARMTPEELEVVAALAVEERFAEGDTIYREGDPSGGMYIVVDGVVETRTDLGEGVTKTLMTARPGTMFGWIALISKGERAATAVAVEPARTARFDEGALHTLKTEHQSAHAKMLDYFLGAMTQQVRAGVERLKETIAWSLEISGLSQLNLAALITDRIGVSVDLANGGVLSGRIVKFEASAAGHELVVATNDGALHLARKRADPGARCRSRASGRRGGS